MVARLVVFVVVVIVDIVTHTSLVAWPDTAAPPLPQIMGLHNMISMIIRPVMLVFRPVMLRCGMIVTHRC